MGDFQSIFERKETKYLLTEEQYRELLSRLRGYADWLYGSDAAAFSGGINRNGRKEKGETRCA